MKTVAMDIIFQGEQAEELRERIKSAVIDLAFRHGFDAEIEITSWNADHEPIVVRRK